MESMLTTPRQHNRVVFTAHKKLEIQRKVFKDLYLSIWSICLGQLKPHHKVERWSIGDPHQIAP
jgi:hypothetical protein